MTLQIIAQETYLIQGKTKDSNNDKPIDYVNIGIKGKNIGTVSDKVGNFKLNISEQYLQDSLTFSRIGYETKVFRINDLLTQNHSEINLNIKITEIGEIQVVSQKLKEKRKGNITTNKSIVVSVNSKSTNSLGAEIGTVIKFPNNIVKIKDFNFNITNNLPDSAKFRLNIYDFQNGEVGDNLLSKNIYFTVRKNDLGIYCVDLSKFNVVVKEKIFVSIENIVLYDSLTKTDEGLTEFKNYRINTSATLTGSKSFYREVSLGSWKKMEYSISPGFWLTYLK